MVAKRRFVGRRSLALVALAVVATACGSSSSSGTSGSQSGSPSTAASGTKACISQAKTEVAKYEAPVTFQSGKLPKPIASLKPSSTTIAYIGDTSAEVLADAYNGLSAAAKKLGFKVKLYNTGGGIPQTDQAITEAINAHVNVIVPVAVPLALITSGIQQATKAHIPIMSLYETPENGPVPDVKYTVQLPGTVTGTESAWFALAKTNCNLQMGEVFSPDEGQSVNADKAMKAIFAKWCPKTCSVASSNETNAQNGTSFTTTLVSSLVQSHPQIRYIYSEDAGDTVYILQALRALGKINKVGVDTIGGVPFEDQAIQQASSGLSAEMASPGFVYEGWLAMDGVLRTLGGATGTESIPQRLVENSSAAAKNPYSALTNYPQQFVTLWQS
jgi:ABC-type sugar transport system substrate-binding protein